jgi:parallel beta-helix repeat protein
MNVFKTRTPPHIRVTEALVTLIVLVSASPGWSASNNTIRGNVISENAQSGIDIQGSGATGNVVVANFIGTDTTGSASLPNGGSGVSISVGAQNSYVSANVIAFNVQDGVWVGGTTSDSNLILGNTIYANGALGIDLDPDGPGVSGGANNDKPSPTIDSIVPDGSDFTVVTTVGVGDTVEFFRVNNGASPAVVSDGSGSGEGFALLGRVVDNGSASGPHVGAVGDTDAAQGIVQVTILSSGFSTADTLSATASGADGTSEFAINATVTLNSAPFVVSAIPDTIVAEDVPPLDDYIDLNDVFSDAEDGNSLTFVVFDNSNPALVTTVVDPADSTLDLTIGAELSGMATVVIRATDSGALSVDDTLVVTVTPVNDTPSVVSAIPDTVVSVNSPAIDNFRYLTDVFSDIEDGSALTYIVDSNDNPTLITATIDADSALDLAVAPAATGTANIGIRATDSGALFVVDTLSVTVAYGMFVTANLLNGGALRPGAQPRPIFSLTVNNLTANSDTIGAIDITNASTGAGTPEQLDGNLTALTIGGEAGVTVLPGGVSGKRSASFAAGLLRFDSLAVAVPASGSVTLTVEGGAALGARDGDICDLAIAAAGDIHFRSSVALADSWPLNPDDSFPIDGMVAAQLNLNPVGSAAIPTGYTRALALDVELPPNGYEADVLNRINAVNLGSALPGDDIERMEAWVDDGDGVFDESLDTNLGSFRFTGSRWEVTGLSHVVPLSGVRMFISVDVSNTAAEGGTIRLSLPALPDVAVGMDSGNDGPLDEAVTSSSVQTITSAERVVLTTPHITPAVVRPGDAGVLLLDIVASNNYTAGKQITQLTVHNTTTTPGAATQEDLDSEIQSIRLRIDANDNGVLDDDQTDPLVGSAYFIAGEATFAGLTWDLPPSTSRHAFLIADVSNTDARDGDSLSVAITGVWSVDFSDATSVIGDWPLDSDTYSLIDGMVAGQIQNFDVTAATIAPGYGPVLALDLVLPGNGYADDVLAGLEIVNMASASAADIADMRLWRDGGDGRFGGDDVEISPLVWSGGTWRTTLLNEPIPAAGTRVFIGVTASLSPSDSAGVRLAVPLNGITVASENDGPIDASVESGQSLLISTAPLLASLSAFPSASTVGSPVTVRMIVENIGSERIDAITADPLSIFGSASMTLQNGPLPPSFDLAVGAVDTFTWVYTSSSAGDSRWSGRCGGTGAISSVSWTTLDISSNGHRVFEQATTIDMYAIESMPFQIDRNQIGVTPLSLTFSTVNNPNASSVQVDGLRIRLEDGTGAGVVPAEILSRISVSEGNATYVDRSALETVGDEIDLTFATPALVPPSGPVTMSITMDILPTTVMSEFRVVIVDSSWVGASDAISGAPVYVTLQQDGFPVMSGLGRIVSAPTQLDVSGVGAPSQRAGRGQRNVDLMTLRMENPGVSGVTSDAAVAQFGVTAVDTNGAAVSDPWQIFERIKIRDTNGVTIGDQLWGAEDTLSLLLAPLAEIETNVARDFVVSADVSSTAPLGTYQLRLAQPNWFDVRDLSTGAPIPVIFQAPPIDGQATTVESPAESLFVTGTPQFPPVTTVGQQDVGALTMSLNHAAQPGVARILIDEVTVRCRNERRRPLVPSEFIDRIWIIDASGEIGSLTDIPTTGDRMTIPVAGVLLNPGESIQLTVRVDISATAPQSILELIVDSVDIGAADANTALPVAVAGQGDAVLPLSSGLTQMLPPPTELRVDLVSQMPVALVPGEQDVRVATLFFENTADAGAGPITLDHLLVRAADGDFSGVAMGGVTTQVRLQRDGTLAGESDTLTVDSTTAYVALSPPIVLQPQERSEVALYVDCARQTAAGSMRFGIDREDVGVVQPSSAVLQIQVEPVVGETFPMWTEAGSVNALSLRESFSNFPNPFAAGHESTTFVYYLPMDARLSLRIFTGRGKGVATLLSDAWQEAGVHQGTRWDGRNGVGSAVVNGVYIAELVVKYDNGDSERLIRKVAVVR